ncbi:response regulator transcription factor [Patescibacteria group bacterium]|nr:response regulator transcription factor [Patescibacteria group bacterium]
MRLLIVEDDLEISDYLKSALKAECIECDTTDDGQKGLELARENDYDLIILDLILPRLRGDKLCRILREEDDPTPIMVISVEKEVDDRVELLNIGADDYLTKPFSLEEFLARVNALTRRPKELKDEIIRIDGIEIDVKRNCVSVGGQEIVLTNKEFALLEYMARNHGLVLSKSRIVENVWDMNADLFSNSIEVHVFNLRKKLKKRGIDNVIHTVANRGYKMELIIN